MDLSLEIIVNQQGDTHHLILRDHTTIGRTSENRIEISEPYISTKHATITYYDDGNYYIDDCGSKNGTFVNDVKVEGIQAIHVGDVLRFGLAACRVVETDPSASISAPTAPGGAANQGYTIKGGAAAASGLAIAGAAVVASVVGAQSMDSGSGNYEPKLASQAPVSWNWDEGYKPGMLTSYPFVKKAKSRIRQQEVAPSQEPFYKRKKTRFYDPFASKA